MNNLRILLLHLKQDFINGTVLKWKEHLITAAISIFFCFTLQHRALFYPKSMDFLMYIFRGMSPFDGSYIELQDKVPQWLMINMLLSYMVGYYPLKDLHGLGSALIIQCRRRWVWWFSKCIWIITRVLFYYIICYMVILIFSIFNGGISISKDILIAAMVLPVLTSISLSLIQLYLSLWVGMVYANLIVFILLILTPFINTRFLITNYLMTLRTSVVMGAEGLSPYLGIIFSIILSTLAIVCGSLKFNKYDIK